MGRRYGWPPIDQPERGFYTGDFVRLKGSSAVGIVMGVYTTCGIRCATVAWNDRTREYRITDLVHTVMMFVV